MQILPLRGAIQNYEWGSRTALAELLGRPVPAERPEAELWLGAHPRAPAEVRLSTGWEPLDAAIERLGDDLLGRTATAVFGRRLPFLLKVLAVAKPLSLQVHPDAARAQSGFARAGSPGIYADPHAKPELVCALTRFTALCGFRPLAEVRERFAAFGVADLLPEGSHEPSALADFLGGWLRRDRNARAAALRRAAEAAHCVAHRDPDASCLLALAAEYPDDPGQLAALFLHRVELAPGDALFLPPGELHCYLSGVAVELMASSDNVLRGGLTSKEMHVDELLEVASFASRRAPVLRAEPRQTGEGVWRTSAAEFELSLLSATADAPVHVAARHGIEILWCLEGMLRVAPAAGGEALALERGQSCVVPAATGAYRVSGAGRSFRAAVPGAPVRALGGAS